MNIQSNIAATAILIMCIIPTASATPLDHPSIKRKFNVPPSADLVYSISAKQNGFSLSGSASLKWRVTEQTYSVSMETRAMVFGKILESKSEGAIDNYGLAPALFTDKRIRKDPTTTTFDRNKKIITFSNSEEIYPIKGGEQDRSSIIWQLISVARAAPHKFKPDTEWLFFVAGQRDAEQWRFKVVDEGKNHSPMGDIDAVHIVRAPPSDAKGQQLDIWLASALEWYPLQLRFTDPDGNTIEQTLESIDKK